MPYTSRAAIRADIGKYQNELDSLNSKIEKAEAASKILWGLKMTRIVRNQNQANKLIKSCKGTRLETLKKDAEDMHVSLQSYQSKLEGHRETIDRYIEQKKSRRTEVKGTLADLRDMLNRFKD